MPRHLPTFHAVVEPVRADETDHAALTAGIDAAVPDGPEMIVVDTCQRYAVGKDENSSRDMGEVFGLLDDLKNRYRAAVLLVYHAGKDSTRGARGSNVFSGSPTTILETKKADDSRLVTLLCTESNNAPNGWSESWQIGVTHAYDPKHGTPYLVPVLGADAREAQKQIDADRVADIVAAEPGINITRLRLVIGGKHDAADTRIADAIARGLIVEHPGRRNARLFYSPDSPCSTGPGTPQAGLPL